jgi:4-aminobutyrate--pyruvate transaminase
MSPTPSRPAGNSAASRDIAHVLHPYTNLRAHERDGPLIMTRGEGVRVFDEDGRDYIEGMAGLWCAALGFGEPRLVEAASAAMARLPFYHLFGGKSHEPGIDLAERLLALAPAPMSKVFFANSGSEANDSAIKLVWYYNNALGRPAKKKIISRQRAYHGVTVATASLTGLPANQRDFDLPIAGILHADCPHHWRHAELGESEEDFATRLADNLDALIRREGPETVAAFIAEPVMGAGGVIVPPRSYFEKIQRVLKRHDVLFIVDEVICGFGRTGRMFGCETFGLEPDMITVAKALSSAYLPISALMISEPIYRAIADNSAKIGTFGHGYTYSGHPVCAAVALEALKIYAERDIVGHVRRVMGRLQDGLRAHEGAPLVGEVRGVGLIAAVELAPDASGRATFDPPAKVGAALARFAQQRGLIVRNMQDTIAFAPPLVIEEAEIDELLSRFASALAETRDWARREGVIG